MNSLVIPRWYYMSGDYPDALLVAGTACGHIADHILPGAPQPPAELVQRTQMSADLLYGNQIKV